MSRILLLEDDLSLINGLSYAFRKQGFELDIARTIKEGEMRWTDGKYDLLVLDMSLPDGSGFDFCKKVRLTSNVPVIFLTASDEETSIIMGLDIGGDDYITKPFKLACSFHASTLCFAGRIPFRRRIPNCAPTASASFCCRGGLLKTGSRWS